MLHFLNEIHAIMLHFLNENLPNALHFLNEIGKRLIAKEPKRITEMRKNLAKRKGMVG